MCAIQRGASYLARPPELDTKTENVIDRFVSYQTWGWIILFAATLIVIGMVFRPALVMEIAGHIICSAVYVMISASVVLSAIFLGQPWAGSGAVAFIAAVHMARVRELTRGRQKL